MFSDTKVFSNDKKLFNFDTINISLKWYSKADETNMVGNSGEDKDGTKGRS